MVLTIILLVLASICDSITETIWHHYPNSIFFKYENKFWDSECWKNKYKDGIVEHGERFFGSTTFLVWLTDLPHLTKMLRIVLTVIAISTSPQNILYVPLMTLIYYIVYTGTFQLFYGKILYKR